MRRRFAQVDVFGASYLRGNPVAVVLDGDGLDEASMAGVARWTNLSETTFVLPPTDPAADYRVRIFTPASELAFAGHPTLGTCHAWLQAGGRPAAADVVVQQSAVGLVPVRVGPPLAFAAPPCTPAEPDPDVLAAVLDALGVGRGDVVRSALLDNGTDWLTVQLVSADAVAAIEPDHVALGSLPKVGVVAVTEGGDPALVVRGFAASAGVPEDPVTGSLNAGVAVWLVGAGVLPERYVASQGTAIGRDGRVEVEQADGELWIGGATTTVVEGTVEL